MGRGGRAGDLWGRCTRRHRSARGRSDGCGGGLTLLEEGQGLTVGEGVVGGHRFRREAGPVPVDGLEGPLRVPGGRPVGGGQGGIDVVLADTGPQRPGDGIVEPAAVGVGIGQGAQQGRVVAHGQQPVEQGCLVTGLPTSGVFIEDALNDAVGLLDLLVTGRGLVVVGHYSTSAPLVGGRPWPLYSGVSGTMVPIDCMIFSKAARC